MERGHGVSTAYAQWPCDQAARLEDDLDLLSTSHEAVLRGDSTSGVVSDLGNGTYGVRFDPRSIPKWMEFNSKSIVILVVDAATGEHIQGSPFLVPCLASEFHSSQCIVEMGHIDSVVAGNVYSAIIRLPETRHSHSHHPHSHHAHHTHPHQTHQTHKPRLPCVVVRPIWSGETSIIPSQSMSIHQSTINTITTLFSMRGTSTDPLVYEASFGGGIVRTSSGRAALLPAVTASFPAPSQCVSRSRNQIGGLSIAAAGRTNTFEIQARDRFGIPLSSVAASDLGECRARVVGPLGRCVVCRLVEHRERATEEGTEGVETGGAQSFGGWTFEYDVPAGFTAISTKGLNL